MKKYCEKCKLEYDEQTKFCEICGEKLIEKEEPVPPKKKGKIKQKLIIFAFVLLTCLVLSAIAFVAIYFSPKAKIERMIAEGQYVEAQALYQEAVKDDEKVKGDIAKTLSQQIAEIKQGYIDEAIDYATATSTLSTIGKMNSEIPSYQKTVTFVETLKQSRDAYEKAEKFLSMKDYIEAIKEYGNVKSIDANYEDAQAKITSCKETYKQGILQQIEAYVQEKNYFDAVQLITSALDVLSNDNDLQTLLVKYQKDELMVNLKSYGDNGDLPGGITYGKAHQKEIDADPEMKSMLEGYINSYRNGILDQAKTMFPEQGYEVAMNVIKIGLEVLPEEGQFKEALAEYESYAPVLLFDLVMLSGKEDWVSNEANVKDNVGNTYNSCYGIDVDCSIWGQEERTYILDGKYTRLEGTLALAEDYKNVTVNVALAFYGDGKFLGYSPIFENGVKPASFSIDVTGVTDLTIADIYPALNGATLYTEGLYLKK